MGYNISKKVLAVIIVVSSVVTAIAIFAAFNIGGFGDAVAGTGGPVAKGFYEIFNAPLLWGSSGGWPTLIAVYVGGVTIILLFAYVVYHFDLPAKITGATSTQPDYSPSLSAYPKEPAEPERAPEPLPAE